MSTIAHGRNGSSAPPFGELARAATARLYRPTRPSALWTTILTAAYELTADEADLVLLQRTRLVDVDGDRFVVSVAGEDLQASARGRLRSFLNHGLAPVGLDCYRVAFVFAAPAEDHDAGT